MNLFLKTTLCLFLFCSVLDASGKEEISSREVMRERAISLLNTRCIPPRFRSKQEAPSSIDSGLFKWITNGGIKKIWIILQKEFNLSKDTCKTTDEQREFLKELVR